MRHAIWWHVYPLGFTGAEPDAGPSRPPARASGRAGSTTRSELGASGLALGPIFASETHGYDTVDHYRIDPRLGDDDDFDPPGRGRPRSRPEGAAGRRVQPRRPLVRRARHWFRRRRRACSRATTPCSVLDHDEPEVRDYVIRVMCHWLDRGRGRLAPRRRLRGAAAVLDATCWHACGTGTRTRTWSARSSTATTRRSSRRRGMHAVTQYELWKAIWSSAERPQPVRAGVGAATGTTSILEPFVPLTFVGNHDVTRIASPPHRRAAPPPRAGRAVHGGRHPERLLRRRAGFPWRQRRPRRRRRRGPPGVPAATRPTSPRTAGQVYRLHQDLIGLRRRHPWLHAGPHHGTRADQHRGRPRHHRRHATTC